jgi:hypothetical protein
MWSFFFSRTEQFPDNFTPNNFKPELENQNSEKKSKLRSQVITEVTRNKGTTTIIDVKPYGREVSECVKSELEGKGWHVDLRYVDGQGTYDFDMVISAPDKPSNVNQK